MNPREESAQQPPTTQVPEVSPWQNLALNLAGGVRVQGEDPPRFRKEGSVIRLAGIIQAHPALIEGVVLASIPAAFLPPKELVLPIAASGEGATAHKASTVLLNAEGNLVTIEKVPDLGVIYFYGITYTLD